MHQYLIKSILGNNCQMSNFSDQFELAISIRDEEIAKFKQENDTSRSEMISLKHEKSVISERLESLGKKYKKCRDTCGKLKAISDIEYEFIVNNSPLKQVTVEQFRRKFLPSEKSLLTLTPSGIRYLREKNRKTVNKFGILGKNVTDRRFTDIGRAQHRKILRGAFNKNKLTFSVAIAT